VAAKDTAPENVHASGSRRGGSKQDKSRGEGWGRGGEECGARGGEGRRGRRAKDAGAGGEERQRQGWRRLERPRVIRQGESWQCEGCPTWSQQHWRSQSWVPPWRPLPSPQGRTRQWGVGQLGSGAPGSASSRQRSRGAHQTTSPATPFGAGKLAASCPGCQLSGSPAVVAASCHGCQLSESPPSPARAGSLGHQAMETSRPESSLIALLWLGPESRWAALGSSPQSRCSPWASPPTSVPCCRGRELWHEPRQQAPPLQTPLLTSLIAPAPQPWLPEQDLAASASSLPPRSPSDPLRHRPRS